MAPTERLTDRRDEPGMPRVDGSDGRAVDDAPTDRAPARSGADEQRPPGRVERATSWLRATPAELTGLAILLVGAVAASLLLWSGASGRPTVLTSSGEDGGAGAAGQPAGTMEDAGRLDAAREAAVTAPDDAGPGDAGPGPAALDATAPGAPPPAVPGGSPPVSEPPGPLTVHVSGAVQRPGLVELPAGSRVGHAVEAAGGLGPGADLATVNLARPLVDGEQVHVLREGEVASPAPASPPAVAGGAAADPADPAGAGGGGIGAGGGGIDAQGRVDLNRATAEELETLPGIGPAKATAIVEHRESHGPFAEPGDIRAVSGIGEKTFQQLADRITAG